jgi:hypothetical protein
MKCYRIISEMLLLILLSSGISAQIDNCTVQQTLPAKKGTTLRLSNKYGDVSFISIKKDSLILCATITIVQDDTVLLRKSMNLVNINVDRSKDTILISTQFDKKFFSESVRPGRKSFSVDYLVKIPAYLDLDVKNEFGNISLEDNSGIINVNLSQGTLSARKLTRGNIKPFSSIDVSHGKVIIDEVTWMILNLRNCPLVNINKGQALIMNSSISKIKLGEISSLICNSRSDTYNIVSINNLFSECTYSSIEIGKLTGQLKSKTTYGSLKTSELTKDFNNVDIESTQSQILINTGRNASFNADIVATDALVEFPGDLYPYIKRSDSNYSTTLNGIGGTEKNPGSRIKIRATSGKLTIL